VGILDIGPINCILHRRRRLSFLNLNIVPNTIVKIMIPLNKAQMMHLFLTKGVLKIKSDISLKMFMN